MTDQSLGEGSAPAEVAAATPPERLSSTLTASPGIWGSLKQRMFGLSHPLSLSDSEGSDEEVTESSGVRTRRLSSGEQAQSAQQLCPMLPAADIAAHKTFQRGMSVSRRTPV